ncbi:thioether cross-link-forming SCIFF peptide maturase, partial [bacterium]
MIHKFAIDEVKILLDVNSGAVHVLDDLAWEIVDLYKNASEAELTARFTGPYKAEEVREVLAELRQLEAEGLLFAADNQEEQYLLPENPVVKSLCLHAAHECNLRCRYCFAGKGHFGGEGELMPAATGRAAIDFLMRASGTRRHCEIDFFGGEPLLNFEVVKELVAFGREESAKYGKEIKFTLTTNALLLDETIAEFLDREAISVVLSLDGRPEVHDRMRPAPGGRGSYREVADRITRFTARRGHDNYYVRGTYTRFNLDFAADVLHMTDLGLKRLSVEPVVAPPRDEWAFREEDLPAIGREYEILAREYLRRLEAGEPFDFFHFNLDLEQGPCLPKRLTGCGAGHEYMAVTPAGDLYPCH